MTAGPWGAILQLPNLAPSDAGYADQARANWMGRQATMSTAQQQAMEKLAAALTAEREKKLADIAAADAEALAEELARLAARGGGGGGGGGRRRGGGGGSTTSTTYAPVDTQASWVDQYLASLGTGASAPKAPAKARAAPSTLYGPNAVYGKSTTSTKGLAKGRGFKAPVKAKAPTKYSTRLS